MMLRWLALALVLTAPSALAESHARTLLVSGTGVVAVAPDQVTITVGVETAARSAGEALEANSRAMRDVLDTLEARGVSGPDVQTSSLALTPRYDNRTSGQQVGIAGYVARNTLSVLVRDIDALGGVLDAVNDAGANAIHSINFGVADPVGPMDAARQAAVADAARKAAVLAEAAGVTLGPLLTLREGGGGGPRPMAMARAETMAMDVPIAEGEVSLSATVHLEYAIQ